MKEMRFYHSCPEFILRGYDYGVSVVLEDRDADVSVVWTAGDVGDSLKLRKNSDYHKESGKLTVYGITLPAVSFENAGELKYYFVWGDRRSDEYVVRIESAGKMPPLAVTELYGRPKGRNVTVFFEVMNPSAMTVDLYDYKLMAYSGAEPNADQYICSLELAPEQGTQLLKPSEVAALLPILPQHHMLEDGRFATVDGFIEACMSDFPKPAFDLAAERESLRIIPVEASTYDENLGKYVALGGMEKLPLKTECTTLVIAPRDATAENGLDTAVFRMVYNRSEKGDRDTPVRYSSLWTIDVRHPSEGVSVAHRALMSPGRLDRGQAIPDLASPYPVIVPLDVETGLEYTENGLGLEFTIDARHTVDAYIYLKTEDGKYCRYAAEEDHNGVWRVELDQCDIYRMSKLEYVITVYDGVRATHLGTTAHPLCTQLVDRCGPYIIATEPTEQYGYDNSRTPQISACFFDASGVDIANSIICVDKKNVSGTAKWSSNCVVYTPNKPLRYGKHSFELMLRDKLGKKTYKLVNFEICKPDALNFYRGEVHAHTAHSDGIAGPEEAYTYAREVGGVDFFAVTDHSHYLDEELYRRQIKTADEYDDPGKFAALYGYEMTWNNTCALWGHANILNADWMIDDIKAYGLPEIFEQLKKDKGAVAMFNHPGLGWGNFHDYAHYSPDADRAMCLSEIKGAGYDREYANMLSLGWHASPAFNEDNHSYNWTTATPSTTYVLAPALTRANILDAFRRRRTYSTTDPTMKIKFRINGEWMGSRLQNPSVLKVEVEVSTESENGIGNIALVSEDNIVVASVNVGALREYRWSFKLDPDFDYYYLRITSAGKYTVTAPVWVEGRNALCIKRLAYNCGDSDYKPNVITAKVKNLANVEAKSVVVDFYLTANTGFDLERTVPYRTVVMECLESGKVACVQCNLPNIPGMRRVSAIVRGMYGRRKYADTAMVLLSPVKIAEILPKSPSVEDRDGNLVSNPYSYFKLCNMSNRDISLDGYYTRLWTTTGKAPTEDRVLHLDGQTIRAGSVLTVWIRPEASALDVEDFNKHYGVMMTEGEDIMVTSVSAISAKKDARRLELMFEKETISRAEYNFKQTPGADIHEGKAITYDVTPNLTGTSAMISNLAEPAPAGHIKK